MSTPDDSAPPPPEITLISCGPSPCDHDYSGWRQYIASGGGTVGTAVCSRCGAHAIDEAVWL